MNTSCVSRASAALSLGGRFVATPRCWVNPLPLSLAVLLRPAAESLGRALELPLTFRDCSRYVAVLTIAMPRKA